MHTNFNIMNEIKIKDKRLGGNHFIHGHARNFAYSTTYRSWQCMMSRCRYKNRDISNKYVNRGIKVCKRWNNFENFLADMGERPTGMSIERKNNNGNYTLSNCCWATPTQQARNRRNAKLDFDKAVIVWTLMHQGIKPRVIACRFKCSESLPRELYKGKCWKDAGIVALSIIKNHEQRSKI